MLYSAAMIEKARSNAAQYAWAFKIRDQIVEAAQPWLNFSDDQLWELMFGPTITRSWMVWSNGYCPACRVSVPMYTWRMDALNLPWKVRCPHCQEIFPKNDFFKFYCSGLDAHGIYNPQAADRSLLFNSEHPDASDPLHSYGVDDGEGYVDFDKRWRFIGAYLIYGQWKQAVLGGIRSLAEAYVISGNRDCARKAAILLDRVADLYPSFDFGNQSSLYERKGDAGYVSTWHDACEETREMVMAYDQIRAGIEGDQELVSFLSAKAKHCKLDNPKISIQDIRRNIEDRILRDSILNRHKIRSNYPRTEIAIAITRTVLGGQENEAEFERILDAMLEQSTRVDGVTGEKGLAAYSAYVIQGLASFLALYARRDSRFLENVFRRCPRLRETYRFHIDTWCFQKYYPQAGDTGTFATMNDTYAGVVFSKNPGIASSMYSFLWALYRCTGDKAFLQVIYHANGNSTDGLPYDLFEENPEAIQKEVREVIDKEGPELRLKSCNKEQWCMAILRSGEGPDARAAWLDFDSGGGHGHADGLNLGLFAKGLDLMPDFGYPPVNYGGWGSPRALWYRKSAAHITVVVNRDNHIAPWKSTCSGRTTLWAEGHILHAVRASAAELILGRQFERTVVLADISSKDFYLLDIFRVIGGSEHAKFMHSHFGQIATHGLCLLPVEDFGRGHEMRHFRSDPSPQPGWSVDWKIEDRYHLLSPGRDIHLRYTDLTSDAQACVAEGWVTEGDYNSNREAWIPRILVGRRSRHLPLASTFISIIEPYEGTPLISYAQRLSLYSPGGQPFPDSFVAIEIQLADGRRDLWVAADVENPLNLRPHQADHPVFTQPRLGLTTDAELCCIRQDAQGRILNLALSRGRRVILGDTALHLNKAAEYFEIAFQAGRPAVVSGDERDIQDFRSAGHG